MHARFRPTGFTLRLSDSAIGGFCGGRIRLLRFYPFTRSGNRISIAGSNAAFSLLMSGIARRFFALKAQLARFKTRFSQCGAFRLQIDGLNLCFLLAVVLHQRDITRTDIGTGTALNAVGNIMFTRFLVIASATVPVKLLRKQGGRTGIRAGTAANAVLFRFVLAHFTGGGGQNTVGDFHYRHIQRRQSKAHEWPAHHHHLFSAGAELCLLQQMADRRTQACPDVSGARHGTAGQRDHAFGQRFAVNHRTLNGKCRADVLHQHADIG